MKLNIKTLSLALASVFAVSAIGAPAASAATTFHSTVVPTKITGIQTTGHVFKTDAGTATCSELVIYSGSAGVKTTATMTLTPHYTMCKAFGFINVPIDVNGCAYIFNANGTTNVECPAGKEIQITVPGCTTSIGPQHFASGMTYTNSGVAPNRDVIAHTAITGIKYNECGTVKTNGTYTGSTLIATISGENFVS